MSRTLVYIFLYLFVFVNVSCSTSKKTLTSNELANTKYVVRERVDTVFLQSRDSIYHNVFTSGDTVFDVKVVEKIRYKDRIKLQVDTAFVDSVVVRNQIKEVVIERKDKSALKMLLFSVLFNIFAIIAIVKKWIT